MGDWTRTSSSESFTLKVGVRNFGAFPLSGLNNWLGHDHLPMSRRYSERCLELPIEVALVYKASHVRRMC